MALDFGKLLLIGGVGFVAYEFFLKPQPAQSTVTAPPQQAAAGIQSTQTGDALTTKSLVQAAATKDGFTMGNVWQWDYYYNKVRGVDADLASKIPEDQRAKNLTFDEWWTVAAANGLSGIVPTRGVGYVRAYGPLAIMEMQ